MYNKSIIVQKYGGSSVGSTNLIKNVARRIIKTRESDDKTVLIVSVMAG
jgi:aspartate kinase